MNLSSLVVDLERLSLWLVLLGIIFVPLEKNFPLHPRKLFRKAFGSDLIYYFLSGLLPRLLLIPPLTLAAAALHRAVPGGFYEWTASLPVWLRAGSAFIIGDIGAYWGHRWSHESPLLWRFHAIHHSADEIDWLVNSRAHPVDMVFTRLCGLIPLYVLGLAQPTSNRLDLVPVLVTIVGTFWGFFIHSNVKWRLGWFEWLISTPGFHHWHHTNDGPDKIDKNYAAMLPWVDRLFGTMYLPETQWPIRYGTDTEVGTGVAEQLVHPFLPASSSKSVDPVH